MGFTRAISLVEVAPHAVRSSADVSYLAVAAEVELSALGEGAFPLMLEPAHRLMVGAGRTSLSAAEKRALIQVFIGQVPTRSALHRWGYRVSSSCHFRGSDEPDTMRRRLLSCQAASCVALRGKSLLTDVAQRAPLPASGARLWLRQPDLACFPSMLSRPSGLRLEFTVSDAASPPFTFPRLGGDIGGDG